MDKRTVKSWVGSVGLVEYKATSGKTRVAVVRQDGDQWTVPSEGGGRFFSRSLDQAVSYSIQFRPTYASVSGAKRALARF
jgi:hypothetical protein